MKKILIVFLCIFFSSAYAFADWDPGDGHKMHYPQLPDPNGWDVYNFQTLLGDDWQCSSSGPVTDIHFWGSWQGDDPIRNDLLVFDISIWSNRPAGQIEPPPFSTPEERLWQRTFSYPEFNVRGPQTGDQGWLEPPDVFIRPDHNLFWQYNITNIQDPFIQQQGEIYWLVKFIGCYPQIPGSRLAIILIRIMINPMII